MIWDAEQEELVSGCNEDKKLTAVPVTVKDDEGTVLYEGFDPRKHKPLKKGDFAAVDGYMDYQAMTLRHKANRMLEQAKKKASDAERYRKFGDEETRKKALRASRMREALKKLEAELAEDGVSADDI
jgi:hypothetical protein